MSPDVAEMLENGLSSSNYAEMPKNECVFFSSMKSVHGLIFLNLPSSESIFDTDIQHLPRSLKLLTLPRAIHLTESCIPDLPPELGSLILTHNANIISASFPHLPSTLRSHRLYAPVFCATWRVCNGHIVETEVQTGKQDEKVKKGKTDPKDPKDKCILS